MFPTPEITVVMPVYNADAYLDDAVISILTQTYQDFEFIIINDGSTDHTASVLEKYTKSDSRVRVYHQENQGMIAALNRGCQLARGEYIARMDADDVSLSTRLERQLEYVIKHPQIGIVGAWIYNIDETGLIRGVWRPSKNPKMLKWTHFFGVCVAHPTVLVRREVLERVNFYCSQATHGEDVDLWLRASKITDFTNVPEILYKYRTWSGSASQVYSQLRKPVHVRLLSSFIKEFLNVEPCREAVEGLRQTRVGPSPENLRKILLTASLIRNLYKTFVEANDLSLSERKEISWDAAKRIASLAIHASRFDTFAFLSLAMQALMLDYRLLSPAAIVKVFERGRALADT